MDVEELDPEARKVVDVVVGQRYGWLGRCGIVQTTVLRAGMLEVPRCPTEDAIGLGDTPAAVADQVALLAGMRSVVAVCHWPALNAAPLSWPDSIGVLVTDPS